MDFSLQPSDMKKYGEDLCLVDSATTHTILKDKKYFVHVKLVVANVTTEGYGKASVMLPGGTKIVIDDALFSSRSNRNLLSFKDIRCNGFHVETKD